MKKALFTTTLITTMIFPVVAFANGDHNGTDNMHEMMEGGANHMGTMMFGTGSTPMSWFGLTGQIYMFLVGALVILAIVGLFKWIRGPNKNETKDKSPLEILKNRYAKGEIDKNTFEDIKKDLT